MQYRVSDIFCSVQGEGYHTGRSATFVRLHGCNLSCDFCDEPLHKSRYQNFSIGKLISAISKNRTRFVVLTGGEPSIRDCNPLIDALQDEGFLVAVETNGYDFSAISNADWVTYSPKDWSTIGQFWDEIKFIVNSGTNIDPILDIDDHKLIWVQPEADGEKIVRANVDKCLQIVKKNPHIRLSLQTHKLINVK